MGGGVPRANRGSELAEEKGQQRGGGAAGRPVRAAEAGEGRTDERGGRRLPLPACGARAQPVDLRRRQDKVLIPFSRDTDAAPGTEILSGRRNVPLRDSPFS